MKRLFFTLLFLGHIISLCAGGLVTNTNQSAMFTRFQCRDATIDIDAAYYNPAGLVHMSSGFYLSVNNQTVGQLQLITNQSQNLGDEPKEYRGKILAPLFPGIFGVYRTGRFAFSGGLTTIGGNGTENFEDGLPSYERELADAIPVMRTNLESVDATVLSSTGTDPAYSNITGYSFDMEMKRYSKSMGYQLNAAYAINNYISLAAGMRIVRSENRVTAGISNILLDVVTNTSTYRMTPANYLRLITTDVALINATDFDILTAKANAMEAVEKMEADVSLSGTGITPVISLNYSRSLRTNWSFKYEFRTKLNLVTSINDGKDANGRYTDGTVVAADIPAMLSVGVTRRPSNRFLIYSGIHYYFDKPVDFSGQSGLSLDMIDNNSYEFAIGAECKLNDDIRLSAGWLLTRPGVNSLYQNERRFSLASNTFGTGLGLRVSRLIDLNIGGSYTLFKKDSKDMSYTPADSETPVTVKEYYDTRKWIISVGVDFLFGENN